MRETRALYGLLILGEALLFLQFVLYQEIVLGFLVLFAQTLFVIVCLPLKWEEPLAIRLSRSRKIFIGLFLGLILGAIGVFAPNEYGPSTWNEVVWLARGEKLGLFFFAGSSSILFLVIGSLLRARRRQE